MEQVRRLYQNAECHGWLTAGAICILGIVMTTGLIIPPMIISLLAAYSTIEGLLLEGVNAGVINKKKRKYLEKINLIKKYEQSLSLFYEKARDDQKITIMELENCDILIEKFNKELQSTASANI